MAENPDKPAIKAAIYNVEQMLKRCESERPADVTSLTLSLDFEIWELVCGWTEPPDELLRFFEKEQCPISLLPAGDWEKRHEELVTARLPAAEKAWRWPSKPLEWNTKPFPPDEEIEAMYNDRFEEALSAMKERNEASPQTPSFIQLLWSCLRAFTSVRELELDLNVGSVYNWKMGRGDGAGYRVPNFTPEMILVQEMATAAFPELSSLSTSASNQMQHTPVDFIGRLSGLQKLKISACTASTPEELAAAISGHADLDELHITANNPTSVPVTSPYSVTGGVIRAAKHLKVVKIEEQPYQGQPSLLSTDMIDALLAHADTLTTLHIEQDRAEFIADPAVLDALLRVLPRLRALRYCSVCMRVPNGLLSQRGYVASGTQYWDMGEYMPPGVTGVHPEMFYACNGNCIRDRPREPTGGYQDKYFYFEGQGWG
jgi:hypothetical protein